MTAHILKSFKNKTMLKTSALGRFLYRGIESAYRGLLRMGFDLRKLRKLRKFREKGAGSDSIHSQKCSLRGFIVNIGL